MNGAEVAVTLVAMGAVVIFSIIRFALAELKLRRIRDHIDYFVDAREDWFRERLEPGNAFQAMMSDKEKKTWEALTILVREL